MAGCSGSCGSCGDSSCGERKEPQALKQHEGTKIDKIIAIASGKGGVGKSLTTALLACELNRRGKKVGILDGDITGPSIPRSFGVHSAPQVDEDGMLLPAVTKTGIKIVSTNMLTADEATPFLWRGPVLNGVLTQFYSDINWGELDYLLIDMPPGTGDTYLSILQSVEIDAAVVVTTPSELALADVKRGVGVFAPYGVPIAGVVENMATYNWEGRDAVLDLLNAVHTTDDDSKKALERARKILDTTKAIRIFGNRTADLCKKLGLDLITSIPLDIALQNCNDAGTPYMLNPAKPAIREAFANIAHFLIRREEALVK